MIVDAVAATSGGGGLSRSRELARTLPRYRPHDELLFVAHRGVAESLHRVQPQLRVLTPPKLLRATPLRVLWEHLSLPPQLARSFRPDAVLAPFNVAPLRWPQGQPPTVVIVSNLAPYAPSIRALYRGKARLRLEALRRLTDLTLLRAEHVFLLSEQAFDLIGTELLRNKAELLPMAPPPTPAFQGAADEVASEQEYFVVVGDLLRFKGIETVIAALARLRPSDIPRVLLVGRPVDRRYARMVRQLARRLGVTDNVRFAGPMPHEEVLPLMKHSYGCIVPSRFENPSRIPVEAMAVGTPIIASDIREFRAACGDAALYFGVDSPDELSRHMVTAWTDPLVRQQLRAEGRRRLASMHVGSASERIAAALERVGR